MPAPLPEIPRTELFARLAQGHAARLTVVTPNRRLAQSLLADFDAAQLARGLTSWETADILPFGALVERLWDDALHSELAREVPLLLHPVQEQTLWEEALRGSQLLSADGAAGQCREAWGLAHQWRIAGRLSPDAAGDDVRAFVEWAARYERSVADRRAVDAARLPDAVAPLLAHAALRKPQLLVLFGFDLPTPQQQAFCRALEGQGVAICTSRNPRREGTAVRLEFPDAARELAAAARWARARLERDPGARIGIVVPDLARSRGAVRRALARVLQPDALLPSAACVPAPFNISLGAPLDEHPLAHDALLVLRLCGPQLPFEDASRVLRSPFILGAELERPARARLDAAIRGRAETTVTLDGLARLASSPSAPRAPLVVERFARLAEHRRAALFAARSAAQWAKAFSETLVLAGFPGERPLDSVEFQALGKWHEALAAFAALERVTSPMGYNEALARLARIVRDAVFQPEMPAVPIQALGVLESAGHEFDHLWITGLTDDAWPMPPRPDPFLPVALQRAAGIAHADAGASLELDRRITAGWLGAAREVVASHARMRGDAELAPSPLITDIPAGTFDAMDVPAYPTWRDLLHGAARIERLRDGKAPAWSGGPLRRGVAVFKDQAACPFRAFARHRLGSEPLEEPQAGLQHKDRGVLVHAMMQAVWEKLRTKAKLDAMPAPELARLLASSADAAIAAVRRFRREALSERLAQLEKQRLVALAAEWLAIERRREDFEVVAIEEKHPLEFGGVTVNAKLDRMDRLAGGGHAVIDYKTGQEVAVSAWLGPRPEEPQVPMYALAKDDVRAVSFAHLKRGELAFCGLSRDEGLLPKVTTVSRNRSRQARNYADWDALIAGWREELEKIGREFRTGEARVQPRRKDTCGQCDQHTFCRIAEKSR